MSKMIHEFPELVSDTLEDQLINKERLSLVIKIIEDLMTGTGVHKAHKENIKRNVDIFIRREIYGETYNAIGARHLLSVERIRQIVYKTCRMIRSKINPPYRVRLFDEPVYAHPNIIHRFNYHDLREVFNEYGKQRVMNIYRAWRNKIISMDYIDHQVAIQRAHKELDRVLRNLSVRNHERQSIKAAVVLIAKNDPSIKILHREGSRIPYYAKIERDHGDGTSSVAHSQGMSVDDLKEEAKNFFLNGDVIEGRMQIFKRYEYTEKPEDKQDELCLTIDYERKAEWTIT